MVRIPTRRIFWGLMLAALGVVWLLKNLGLTTYDFGDVLSQYWPCILIFFGVVGSLQVLSANPGRGILWGSVILNVLIALLGVALLGNINGWYYVNVDFFVRLIVPVLLLLLGLSLLRGSVQRPGARTLWAVMGGPRYTLGQWDDLSVISVMGGQKVDLTQAGIPMKDVIIDVYAVMGGADIFLPDTVTVECQWTGALGGLEFNGEHIGGALDFRKMEAGQGPKVLVRAHTIMGGAKVVQVRGF